MYLKITTLLLFATLTLASCHKHHDHVTLEDVEPYLQITTTDQKDAALENRSFWTVKLETHPHQFPYAVKVAAVERQLFELTGQFDHLNASIEHLKAANEQAANRQSSILRETAAVCLTAHRFEEALQFLEMAEQNGDRLEATEKMLFDAHFELGNDEAASHYLEKHRDYQDFDYVVRKARWVDAEGDLEGAIKLMEDALAMTELTGNAETIAWVHANLADFYGHNGQIHRSVKNYKAALEHRPTDDHGLEGLAWVAYYHQGDVDLARRIVTALNDRKPSSKNLDFLTNLAKYKYGHTHDNAHAHGEGIFHSH